MVQDLVPQGIPQLFVNDGPLEPTEVGLLQPLDPQRTSLDDVRKQLKYHGYAFLKGLLPREDVLKARAEYFAYLSPTGLLKPGTDPVEGVFDTSREVTDYPGIGTGAPPNDTDTSAAFMKLTLQAHGEGWYKDDFCKHPALLDYVAKITGWGPNTLPVQRTLLRNNLPLNKAIGVHYDYIFLRHGEDSVLTVWIPMGDVKLEGGGLIYLEKGHELGKQIEHEFAEKARADGMTDEEAKFAFNKNMMSGGVLADGAAEFGRKHGRRWLVSAYEAGDVVLHSSYAIHASTINHDPDNVIRLGTDLRYVDSGKPWDERWDKVYELDDGL